MRFDKKCASWQEAAAKIYMIYHCNYRRFTIYYKDPASRALPVGESGEGGG